MARVVDCVPSKWKHRSFYWKSNVNRQFKENNSLFISFKNQGITEIFSLGSPYLQLDHLNEGK